MLAGDALAGTTITLPFGWEAQMTNVYVGGCNVNAWGYQLGSGSNVQLGINTNQCPPSYIQEPNATIGPVSSQQDVRVFINDTTCGVYYYSDGTGSPYNVNHVLVTGSGPYQMDFGDGGPFCGSKSQDAPPTASNSSCLPSGIAGCGQLLVTVTVVPGPPLVTVTPPPPPAGQNGFFNSANVAASGGQFSFAVSAQAATGDQVIGISCTDNGQAATVTNQSGTAPVMTGTVSVPSSAGQTVSCTATDDKNNSGSFGNQNTATVKVDTTAPAISVPSGPLVAGGTSNGADLSSYPVSATDPDSGDTPSVSCNPAAPAHFPIGDSTVSCQATDRAGNTASAQFTVHVTPPPPPPPKASFGPVSTAGPIAMVTVACGGVSGQVCSGTLTATINETFKRGKVVAVSAAVGPATVTRTVVVATGAYSVAAGKSATVQLTLSAAAAKLLGIHYRLATTVTLPAGASEQVTFQYGLSLARVLFSAAFDPSGGSLSSLTAILLPPSATVTVSCRGGTACRRTFKPKGDSLDMTSAVAHRHLRAGTRVIITVTAPSRIGNYDVITIRAGKAATYSKLCLAPGARAPARCHA
jgi:hypothetical protein